MIDRELIDEYAMKLGINDLPYAYIKSLLTELVEKSINSTRLSERRADGSNSKAKELCPKCNNRLYNHILMGLVCCKCGWFKNGHND